MTEHKDVKYTREELDALLIDSDRVAHVIAQETSPYEQQLFRKRQYNKEEVI